MMTVDFTPVEVTTYLLCRRGINVHRKVRIDIGRKQAIYNALPQCALEVVDATGHVWSRADITQNRGYVNLSYQGPPVKKYDPLQATKEEKKKILDREKKERKAKHAEELAGAEREKSVKELQKEIDDFEVKYEGTTAPKSDQRPEKKDNDPVQQVGGERSNDGETLRRSVHLQVPLVDQVDARLVRASERGSKGGSDGLHRGDDESDVLDD